MNNPRILVIRTDRIGELLLTVPLITALREAYPKARICVLARRASIPVLEGNTDIDEIIAYPDGARESWWIETIRVLRVLKSKIFDMVFVVNSKKAFHLAMRLKHVPIRVGFERKWSALLSHTVRDERAKGEQHEIANNLMLLGPLLGRVTARPTRSRALGLARRPIAQWAPRLGRKPTFALDPKAERWADQWIKTHDISSEEVLIAISPFSTHPKKEWHPKGFVALARLLIRQGHRVVFLGAPTDVARGADLTQETDGAFNLCGQTNLKQAASILRRCRLLVSNDSGLVHIAVSLGIKTVALFRNDRQADSPERWGPFGKGHAVLSAPPGLDKRSQPDTQEVFKACLKQLSQTKFSTQS